MQIVGRGFLAQNLRGLADAHPHVTALAAGVSRSLTTDEADFQRDAELVAQTVRSCRECGRLMVYFSTSSTALYGPESQGCEDEVPRPVSPYGRHKLAMESVVRGGGIDYLILRLANPVGAGQPEHQLLPALVRQVQSGAVTVYRGAYRDIIDIADVVTIIDLMLAAASRGRPQRVVVNVGSGFPVPAGDIVEHIEKRVGVRAAKTFVEVNSPCRVSLDKLRALVPAIAGMGFGPRYFARVIDRYVPVPAGA